ncbi:OLC1v1016022C1 [Oldenlandia corymbosa var. corymbosa]|uniref:OLC1v1016022C1 n=1 Tax=Oldenlandia corymbosa var. corymbosa TaxID=529605 RepID=A0AAV1E788_OLDCO|nr:OLC1v1016022C1 [Oldenlandia corymbosa var. corymbosa]
MISMELSQSLAKSIEDLMRSVVARFEKRFEVLEARISETELKQEASVEVEVRTLNLDKDSSQEIKVGIPAMVALIPIGGQGNSSSQVENFAEFLDSDDTSLKLDGDFLSLDIMNCGIEDVPDEFVPFIGTHASFENFDYKCDDFVSIIEAKVNSVNLVERNDISIIKNSLDMNK